MAAKFVLNKTSSGTFHFNLLAGNGQEQRPYRPGRGPDGQLARLLLLP
jgi:hypothetical protein